MQAHKNKYTHPLSETAPPQKLTGCTPSTTAMRGLPGSDYVNEKGSVGRIVNKGLHHHRGATYPIDEQSEEHSSREYVLPAYINLNISLKIKAQAITVVSAL